MKKIFIYAYKNVNLGDDLFIKMLCDRYPDTKFFTVASYRKISAFEKTDNLIVLPKLPIIDKILSKLNINFSFNSIYERLISRFTDAIVYIGGSIFIEPKNWEMKVNKFNKSIIDNKPLFVIGSNFGNYSTSEYLEEYTKAFSKVEDICFRDDYSFNLFKNLKNARQASDVVFSLDTSKFKNSLSDSKNKGDILISVISLSNRPNLRKFTEDYESHIVSLVENFVALDYNVLLMGFCKKEGDEKSIDSIFKKLKRNDKKSVKRYTYDGDINTALKKISCASLIAGSRFHAMILGWVFSKPVYPIVYSQKSINVIKDVNFDGAYSEIRNLNKTNFPNIISSIKKLNSKDLKIEVSSSQRQFEKLDKFIKSIK